MHRSGGPVGLPSDDEGAGGSENLIVVAPALDVMERLEIGTASLVFLHPLYDTGGMGALAFFPEARARNLGEHLEEVSRLLQQSKRILVRNGALFLLTDPYIAAHHRLLADRLFGAVNFATQIIVPSPYKPRRDSISADYNVILVYQLGGARVTIPTRPRTPDEAAAYGHTDSRGPYRLADLTRTAHGEGFGYIWAGIELPPNREWRYPREVLDRMEADGRIVRSPGRGKAYLKAYLAEAPEIPLGSIWGDVWAGLAREEESWPEEHAILWAVRLPLVLMERIIKMGTRSGERVVAPSGIDGSMAVAAARLGRTWTVGVNHSWIGRGVAARVERHGGAPGGSFEVVGHDEVNERFPAEPQSYEDLLSGLLPDRTPSFLLGEPVSMEEGLRVEFKEVDRANPRNSIKSVVDDYAVAFLNRDGGRIFWGIRDRDRAAVGMRLDSRQRDDVRKLICNKMSQLVPAPSPSRYAIELHPVIDRSGSEPDLWIVELRINAGDPKQVYATSEGRHWIRTEAGITPLAGPALMDEYLKRAALS